MITLKSDCLQFSFPSIAEELERLVESRIRQTLSQVLSEDGEAILASMWAFGQAEPSEQNVALRRVTDATAIEHALRRICARRVQLREDFAAVSINFQRTLRIPDDGKVYPLPAGMGSFPLRDVDNFENSVPESWLRRGGILMPMHQSEALWLNFDAGYPFALTVAAGKVNAVTGELWTPSLQRAPQNYLVVPEQPWIDGFAVRKGIIRQFVAMPLGDGYSVEEQLTGSAETGGVQLMVFPMKAESYFRKRVASKVPTGLRELLGELVGDWIYRTSPPVPVGRSDQDSSRWGDTVLFAPEMSCSSDIAMGLAAGGTMRQEIYADPHGVAEWDTAITSRCFVHLCNSLMWRQITGSNPPHPPLTSKEYAESGIPWFDYYRDDLRPVAGSKILASVKSVLQMGKAKGSSPLPDNTSVTPKLTIQYGNTRRPDQVREWVEE